MNRGWSCWKDIIKRAIYSISFLVVSALYVVINRYTGREKDLATFIDYLIPFNRYFILAYIFWYAYVTIFLIYFCMSDEKKYYKVLVALNVGMLICYFTYLFFPTVIARPVLNQGDDMIGKLFSWLYRTDNAYNCFPSIHVMNTTIIALYVQRDDLYLNRYIKTASLVIAAAIIYSTLAIKQHVFLDAVSAVCLAYGLHFILDYREIFAKVKRLQRISET